jgi:hypothetical protein
MQGALTTPEGNSAPQSEPRSTRFTRKVGGDHAPGVRPSALITNDHLLPIDRAAWKQACRLHHLFDHLPRCRGNRFRERGKQRIDDGSTLDDTGWEVETLLLFVARQVMTTTIV